MSEVVLEEIQNATLEKPIQLLGLVSIHQPKVLPLDPVSYELANTYLAHQIL